MKIHILSDLHNEFVIYQPHAVDADVIIIAGDIDIHGRAIAWAKQAFPNLPVLYVMGNHEFYSDTYPDLLDKMRTEAAGTNVHILENNHIEIHGVHFLGCSLWTDFQLFGNKTICMRKADSKMNDYHVIHNSISGKRLKPGDTAAIHNVSLQWLREKFIECQGSPIVVITHHAPSIRSILHQYKGELLSSAFASRLDTFVENSNALVWVHGHTHNAEDYMIGNTRVVCNPRGYPNERTDFNPDLVIKIPCTNPTR